MPRITRKQQKIFAENATNNGVFGSLQGNDPTISSDPDAIQGRSAYSNGWNDATYSAELLPPLEEFQALQYLFSRQIAYLMQEGVAEWDSSTTYYKGALVKKIQSDGSFILYVSLIDNNTGNLVTDTTKWQITNTSTNFHQGIPNWRADVIYSEGDWVKSYNSSSGWTIYESKTNNNLNNEVSDTDYWTIKPFISEFPLLTPVWFDYEVADTSWLKADTFSWQSGTVYENVYNHLVDDIDGITSSTETIGSYTITYYQATDGHKIVLADQETTVANIYNESGVAWYYILDTTNQRFKLPRENPTREELIQTIRAKGSGITVGWTDGTNVAGSRGSAPSSAGCVGFDSQRYGEVVGANSVSWGEWANGKIIGITTDSTKSGIISDMTESTSVYKGKQYLYFYVGQFTQTATEQTAGLNAELFNGKLDLDLENITNVSKETIIGWSVPDYSSGVSISSGYTATKDGYIYVYCGAGTYGYGGWATVTIGGQTFTVMSNDTPSGQIRTCGFFPIAKGETVTTSAGGSSAGINTLLFYPLKGV